MRTRLASRLTERSMFRGTVHRFGTKPGWKGRELRTMLLVEVTDDTGTVVADHLWLNDTKALAALALQPGEVVEFQARVTLYTKGYRGRRLDVDKPLARDYRLERPTRVRRVPD